MTRVFVAAAIVALFAAIFHNAPQQGFGNTCINESCMMAASSSLSGVIGSIALVLFVFLYRQLPNRPDRTKPVGVFQRLGALYIDFFIVLAGLTSILTLPVLLVEARHTGTFQWSFERAFPRETDTIATLPAGIVMFVGLFAYFYIHARRRRQTVGQYLLGYRLRGKDDSGAKPAFTTNIFLSWIGMCMWPISLICAWRRPDKAFWWNLATNTEAVRVTSDSARTGSGDNGL